MWMVYEADMNSLEGWVPKRDAHFDTRTAAEAERTRRLGVRRKEYKPAAGELSRQDDYVLAQSIYVIDLDDASNALNSEPIDEGSPF